MKKTTAFITAVLVCLSVLFGAFDLCLRSQAAPGRSFPERDGEVLFEVGSAYNVAPGDTVTIPVFVSGPNTQFHGLSLRLEYDSAVLSAQSVAKGELLRNASDDVMCMFDHVTVPGEISVAVLCPTQPVDPNGELIRISFTALSGFDSEQAVSIAVREFYQMPLGSPESTPIPYEVSNGVISPFGDPDQIFTVTFVDWDGTLLSSQQIAYGAAASAPADPTRAGWTFIGWDKDFSNITSNLTVTALYEQNGQEAGVIGDVNCDGTVDFSDAASLAAYLMGGAALSDEALANANANGDDGVTIADITAIYAIIFG